MDIETCPSTDADAVRRMRAIFAANAHPLYTFLLRLTRGQRELAEDLLQETMLRAWRRLTELPTEADTVRRWLFIVARHLVIDAARARAARPTEIYGVDVAWLPSAENAFDEIVDRFALADALRQLTPEHRAVLVELYYGGASVAETANRIGIPEGTVRSRSFYALRAARGVLDRVDELVS
ncbi:sigma-70 family RNA polymerase sigma factor [Micromonospora sp. C51]|uniref:sigma-70 family RNA polymerase sigma factor n=1 Tax=Micromonospora sp. C51 TaxID=2824879 RepID=UPI0027DD41B4|nr:sigma-70 family RNA polymerase sigma factor [Micromonospora sp. C51]